MKKIYLKPEIESTILNTEWAMCTQDPTVPVDSSKPNEPSNPGSFPFGSAPRRRVF